MAVSGSFDFTMTADEIFRRASAMAGGGPLTGEELKDATKTLNLLLNDMMNDAIPLSFIAQETLTLYTGEAIYDLPSCINDIHDAVLKTNQINSSELVMTRLSLTEFNQIPQKNVRGRPTQYTTERTHECVKVRVWPTPNNIYTMNMYVFIKPDDIDRYTDNVRVQTRMLPAIVAKLAYEIALTRDLPEERLMRLEKEWMSKSERAKHEDRERVTIRIVPQIRT